MMQIARRGGYSQGGLAAGAIGVTACAGATASAEPLQPRPARPCRPRAGARAARTSRPPPGQAPATGYLPRAGGNPAAHRPLAARSAGTAASRRRHRCRPP